MNKCTGGGGSRHKGLDAIVSQDTTHHDGCWRDPKHHACAVARIERDDALIGPGIAAVRSIARVEALEEAARFVESAAEDFRPLHHVAAAIRVLKDRRP